MLLKAELILVIKKMNQCCCLLQVLNFPKDLRSPFKQQYRAEYVAIHSKRSNLVVCLSFVCKSSAFDSAMLYGTTWLQMGLYLTTQMLVAKYSVQTVYLCIC